jgi:DNA-binding MarR family transcriptional regulator
MENVKEKMMEINQLCNEVDGLYHSIALDNGLSDNTFWILYILASSEEPIIQADLCSNWFFSKQTVNSSVTSMVKKGWVTLESAPGTRNKKNIVLTDDGRKFCTAAIGSTIEMECSAFSKFSEKDREAFISLFRRWMVYMQEEYELRRDR